jgi:alpha-tubulin suppressor-like RCC1 family protein
MSAFRLLAIAALALAIASPAFAKSVSRARLVTWPNPSKLGQPAVMLAEIDGLGGGAPKGIVTFTEGDTILGSRPINPYGAGQATLAAGIGHSCALTAAGGVACWGWNFYGQLGDGASIDRHAPVSVSGLASEVVAIAAGARHNCALNRGGAVKCWGENMSGQLGDGTIIIGRYTPVDVAGLGRGVVAVAAGSNFSCALTRGGGVKCWGHGAVGELGAGPTVEQSNTPIDVEHLSSGIVAIAAGGYHSCALTKGGGVKCWGDNDFGQIGDGSGGGGTADWRFAPVNVVGLERNVIAIAAGLFHTCALISGGAVKCWGLNEGGALGDDTTTKRNRPVAVSGFSSGVVAVTAGHDHSCALTRDGAVKCWGRNNFGQIGDGTTTNRLTPVSVSGFSSGAVAITAGDGHTCALTRDGATKCWGWNYSGWLGDGTTTDRHTPVTVTGLTALVRSRTWISTRALGVGAHALRASYSGDSSHGGSSIRYGHAVE